MLKLHPFPGYQSLTLHLACLSVIYLLSYPSSSNCNSRSTYGMMLKLTQALALAKRSQLMVSTVLSRDSCKLTDQNVILLKSPKFEKWWHQSTSLQQENLLVKVLCEYNLYISRYSLVIIFQTNSGL